MNKNTLQKLTELNNYDRFATLLAESNCSLCELSKERQHIVIHRGNPKSKVLFIGEAPGRTEDLEGKPFVGRAGKMLDHMFSQINFDTNKDGLIINVVKCRPPKNRVPKKTEVATCRPLLQKQIQLIQPRIILLLGSTALKHILPEIKVKSMQEVVGEIFQNSEYPDAKLMVLFHPAYLLYDPRKKSEMLVHLQKLKQILKKQ